MRKPLMNKRRSVPLRISWLVPIGLAFGVLLLFSPTRGSMRSLSLGTTGPACSSDQECSDGVFCNGIERCVGSSPGYCAAGTTPCNAGQRCDEDRDVCEISCADPDHDGDGHRSIRCGGDDCDDRDANRYPGRQEVCDEEGHDEDCDPTTFGHRDYDGDGEVDIRCVNREANGTLHRGTDYDDRNVAVRVGSMICDGPDMVVISGSASVKCPDGTQCVVQPNLTGICIVPPPNYVAPPRFIPPPVPEALPSLRTLLASPDNAGPIRPEVSVPPAKERAPDTVIAAPKVETKETDSSGGGSAEVESCKRTLQSGQISWGGSTTWAPANIDRLCSGTKDAQGTIACFQKVVGSLGWEAAIDKCK